MEAFAVMSVFIVLIVSIYKLFAHLILRKERLLIVEKLSERPEVLNSSMFDALSSKSNSFEANWDKNNVAGWTIRIGCLLVGVGLGIFIIALFDFYATPISVQDYIELTKNSTWQFDQSPMRQAVNALYPASALFFGGIGLVSAFFIEKKSRKADK